MKRALAMLLTVAMVGSLMFMGFAGTAAAQDQSADQDADIKQGASATNAQSQYVGQENVNAGDEINIAYADDDGDATAGSSVTQSNDNSQTADATATNTADINQSINQDFEDDFPFF
ncbi:hypothetical protein [Natronorubrum bangense]|uniref:Acetylglutamate kinase n=2 Tax=Natronorubrum bangense TaxID=61858 RepID=A0A4D6HSX2_9EURY|nr:hypothetical protein [Natronorubrum bangense]ELY43991.1 membrane protein involved in toxin uptake [Natronorubrum bangense JCM 10635]QCC53025.1 acetylglutamate kinase [Natronorubrum bangense]QCC56282.1 acetylglutamate kinase [Natronorubrum bangense]